ncbi:hypothetical protein, partial [Streptomyces scabiei]
YQQLREALATIPTPLVIPRYPDDERRERYAHIIRTRIKTLTFPALYPGASPTSGATEYDLADAVLAAQDAETSPNGELSQPHTERHTTPHLDPRLRTVIAAAIRQSQTAGRQHVDCECGSCAASMGPCHCEPAYCPSAPHDGPEADADAVLRAVEEHLHTRDTDIRAELDRLQRAIDDVRRFNETTAEASCRVQAAEHARDTLNILDRALDPAAPPQDGKKPCGCCSIDEVCSNCGSCASICYGCG